MVRTESTMVKTDMDMVRSEPNPANKNSPSGKQGFRPDQWSYSSATVKMKNAISEQERSDVKAVTLDSKSSGSTSRNKIQDRSPVQGNSEKHSGSSSEFL